MGAMQLADHLRSAEVGIEMASNITRLVKSYPALLTELDENIRFVKEMTVDFYGDDTRQFENNISFVQLGMSPKLQELAKARFQQIVSKKDPGMLTDAVFLGALANKVYGPEIPKLLSADADSFYSEFSVHVENTSCNDVEPEPEPEKSHDHVSGMGT